MNGLNGNDPNTDDLDVETGQAVTALKDMLKAGKGDGSFFKANKKNGNGNGEGGKGGDDDDDDSDDYNESYMKKNMSKFMKNNPSYMKKMGYMKKAIDTAYDVADTEGDLAAEATMVDGTEIFKAFKDFGTGLLKAFESLNDRVENIENQTAYNTELAAGSAEVLLKALESIDQMASQPLPPKGSQMPDGSQPIQKAKKNNEHVQDPNSLLMKAMDVGIMNAKKVLFKAATNGNHHAGSVLTEVESCFNNMSLLQPASLKLITDLAEEK